MARPTVAQLQASGALFQSWPEDSLAAFADTLLPALFEEGDYICHQGDPSHFVYVLMSGSVDVVVRKEDRSAPLCTSRASCWALVPTYGRESAKAATKSSGPGIEQRLDCSAAADPSKLQNVAVQPTAAIPNGGLRTKIPKIVAGCGSNLCKFSFTLCTCSILVQLRFGAAAKGYKIKARIITEAHRVQDTCPSA